VVLDVAAEDEGGGSTPDRCAFCAIASGKAPAEVVLDAPAGIAFLDRRPLVPGHVLLAPRGHVATLSDLPTAEIGPFFTLAQRLARAVPLAVGADGSFVAINNVVSQSVPHLHVHIVPRRFGDRLFSRNLAWTRHPYRDQEEMRRIADAIRAALREDEAPTPDRLTESR
jgi:histidine triad (HIT) family protein